MFVAWRLCVLVGVVASLPLAAAAQIPASEQPGRQRERFIEQPVPKARPSGSTISLPSTVAPAGAAAIQLIVKRVRLVGGTVYPESELAALSRDIVGHPVALTAVYELAQRIAAKYGKDGYVLSRAIVPPQELNPKGAIVTIQVIEGYIDNVEWPAQLGKYRDVFSGYGAKIVAERPTNIKTVTRYLLLAGDLPGIDVKSSFQASSENPSASTLLVETAEKRIDAEARIDNRGTEARGPWEFLASATFNNSFRQHEAFTLTYAGAVETNELQHAALGYRQVLTSEGMTAFADGSYSWGKPGTDALIALDFASQSIAADAGLSFPLIRGRERNLTVSGLVFMSNDEGDILAAPSSVDRLRGIRLKADADSANDSGATTQVNLTFSQGIEGLGGTMNGDATASRANGRVDFTKVEGTVSREQSLGGPLSVRGAAQGQYAFTPLLAPEECGYGGKDFGRAFDPSEITGDSCWSVNGEVRLNLPDAPNPFFASSQVYAFFDYGGVYRIAPAAGTSTNQDGSSAGAGLRLGNAGDRLNADLSAVKPLSGRSDDSWRYFLTARAHY